MEKLLMILLIFVTLAFAAGLAGSLHSHKRWKETVCHYLDTLEMGMREADAEVSKRLAEMDCKIDENREAIARLEGLEWELGGLTADVEMLRETTEDLRLDYREARNAASQINDYAGHLANIFNYDPLEERKKSRKESGDG